MHCVRDSFDWMHETRKGGASWLCLSGISLQIQMEVTLANIADTTFKSHPPDVPLSQRHLSTSVTQPYAPGQRAFTHQQKMPKSGSALKIRCLPLRMGPGVLFIQSEQRKDCTTGFCSLSSNWLSSALYAIIRRRVVCLMLRKWHHSQAYIIIF